MTVYINDTISRYLELSCLVLDNESHPSSLIIHEKVLNRHRNSIDLFGSSMYDRTYTYTENGPGFHF